MFSRKSTYQIKNIDEEKLEKYECDEYIVWAIPNTCFFCEWCTDIFYDYINGPYMLFCTWDIDTNSVVTGKTPCKKFKEMAE